MRQSGVIAIESAAEREVAAIIEGKTKVTMPNPSGGMHRIIRCLISRGGFHNQSASRFTTWSFKMNSEPVTTYTNLVDILY